MNSFIYRVNLPPRGSRGNAPDIRQFTPRVKGTLQLLINRYG